MILMLFFFKSRLVVASEKVDEIEDMIKNIEQIFLNIIKTIE